MSQRFEPVLKPIDGVQFSVMGPNEIQETSVVEVTKFETFDKDIPVIKGLFDLRMGTTDIGKTCTTCGLNNKGCPGHFGHINLARPVYHYHFIDITLKVLKCTCFRCGKLLVNRDSNQIQNISKKTARTRWKEICDLSSKISRCGQETEDGCGCKQPDRYKVNDIKGIYAIWKDGDVREEQRVHAEYVKTLFEKISDEDVSLLGFMTEWCRPEWLICSVVPVPPPAVRPSVKQGGDSQRMDDDLTYKLAEIIRYNKGLQKKISNNNKQDIVDGWTDLVQYHVATLVDNELSGGVNQATHRSGRPLKAILQRLKGKEGRIRSNLMGKRVDFSARSVITPDPNIDLDELGVPIKIALNLTYPEVVSERNLEKLLEYVRSGPLKWPGAKSVLKGKKKITITLGNKDKIELNVGDIVNRQLLDGDYVLFNRQPSLHKMSMMGHRVRVMKGNTFRLNVSVTPPYNADFDGDEMNMHVPQSISTVSELINIASVNKQIISPRENKPIITIVQDTLLGIFKLTHSEIVQYPEGSQFIYSSNTNLYEVESGTIKSVDSSVYTKTQMMNIICSLSTFNGVYPKPDKTMNRGGYEIELWSGRAILSYILPENVSLKMPNGMYDTGNSVQSQVDPIKQCLQKDNSKINMVKIENGVVKQGTFDKSMFSKTSKGLIHTINNDLGDMRAHDFINDLQKIVSYILLIEGFSVGISDMIADKDTTDKISNVIRDRKKEIDGILQEVHLDIFETIPGQTPQQFFESKVNSLLNKTIKDTGNIALSNLDPKNRVTYMVNSGSKGKPTNISQMVACLGQQNVDGKRIPYGFNGRTLPHYYKYDDSAEARGFVVNSFISGQTPQEFFFHAMGGREGLIDTAVKTSLTGYTQRQLVKAMEDLMVGYDYAVRGGDGTIVQFIYGSDGMDGTYVESQPLYLTKLTLEKIVDKYRFDENTDWSMIINKSLISKSKTAKAKKRFEASFQTLLNHREFLFLKYFQGRPENNANFPVHIQRIVENVCIRPDKHTKRSNIDPITILDEIEKLKGNLFVRKEFNNNQIFMVLLDIHLSPKVLICEYHIQKDELTKITEIIHSEYHRCKISPAEMVGALAAQSIGEPATQMTLNTFHFAGVSAKSNVTRGIPRLKELLHVSKNLKSPSTSIYLKDPYKYEETKAKYIKNILEHTQFKDCVSSASICYDPLNSICETDIIDDRPLLEVYREFVIFEAPADTQGSPWILRFVFNKDIMLDKNISMEDIHISLMEYDISHMSFIYTDDNAKQLIGRLSFDITTFDEFTDGVQDQTDVISRFKNILDDIFDINIKGVDGISDIIVSEIHSTQKKHMDYETTKEFVLETDGTNLLQVMINEFSESSRCISNDITEVYDILGIEATREILFKEIFEVVDHAGEYINSRHLELLCDVMTSKGTLFSINRQGINSGDIGPLAKCSFEDTSDQLIKAAVFSETDKLSGVSSNIMMGQVIRSGTGLCDIFLDEQKMISQISEEPDEQMGFQGEINDVNIHQLMDINDEEDGECALEDFKFSIE
jgi:DNA-directed RNA polymerase II subunit RPB1